MDFQYYKDLLDVASDNSKIVDFFQFVNRIHTLADCKKKKKMWCETYVYCLEGVLSNPEKLLKTKGHFLFRISYTSQTCLGACPIWKRTKVKA